MKMAIMGMMLLMVIVKMHSGIQKDEKNDNMIESC